MEKVKLHCWEPDEENEHVCLLEDGHDGPHEWTPTENVRVKFKSKKAAIGNRMGDA